MNLRSVDLNLFVVFLALFEERSVARAAARLDVTPSAVSHALKRLRVAMDDPLLIRTAQGMDPTPAAARLAGHLRKAFAEIEGAIDVRREFDAATERRTFYLRVSDYIGISLLPRLCTHMRTHAPYASLHVQHFEVGQSTGRVEYEGVDIRLSVSKGNAGFTASRRMLDDVWMVLMRRNHPAADVAFTLERYLELDHLKVTGVGSSILDELLAEAGRARKVLVQVPTWLGMFPVIATTDLVAAMPAHWLDSVVDRTAFVARPLPMPQLGLAVDAVWHPRNDSDPGHRWFRESIHDIFQASQHLPA